MSTVAVADAFPPGCDVMSFLEDFVDEPALVPLREMEALELNVEEDREAWRAFFDRLTAEEIAEWERITMGATAPVRCITCGIVVSPEARLACGACAT